MIHARLRSEPRVTQSAYAAGRASLDIPALSQVLDFCAGRIRVDIELKEPGCELETLRAVFRARFRFDDFLVTSFDPTILANLRYEGRGIRTGLLVSAQSLTQALHDAERLEADYLAPEIGMLDARSLAARRASPLPLLPWTVNDREDLKRLLEEDSVAGIITDQLRVALDLRRLSI